MKKFIVIAYFFILSFILVVFGGFVFLPKYQPQDAYSIRVSFSPFQTRSNTNVAYVQAAEISRNKSLDAHVIEMNWREDGTGNCTEPTIDDLREGIGSVMELSHCDGNLSPNADERQISALYGCPNLVVDLYTAGARDVLERGDRRLGNPFVLKSTTIPCDRFHFFSKPGIIPFSEEYLKMLGVDREAVKDANLMDVIAPSAFVTGKPNEVLLACYIHGRPCQGDIEIEQLGEQENRIHKVIQADDTGITAFDLTIDVKSDFRFTVGDEVLNATFTPVPFQKGFHVGIKPGYYIPPNSYDRYVKLDVDQFGSPKDLKMDVFSDYAWIARRRVFHEYGPEIEFPSGLGFTPESAWYLFKNYEVVRISEEKRRFEPLNTPQILFVRIATYDRHEAAEILPDEPSQTIPFIVWGDDKDKFKSPDYRLVFGTIYQTFARIDALNEMDDQDKGEQKNKTRSAFDDVVVIAPYLLECMNAPLFSQKKQPFEKYLLAKLAQAHHPQIVTVNDADEVYTEEVFRAERGDKIRSVSVFVIIWLIVGIILFVVISRDARIRRQQAWFDAAARGEAKGLLPGTPAWGKVMIGVFILVIVFLVYYMMIV